MKKTYIRPLFEASDIKIEDIITASELAFSDEGEGDVYSLEKVFPI